MRWAGSNTLSITEVWTLMGVCVDTASEPNAEDASRMPTRSFIGIISFIPGINFPLTLQKFLATQCNPIYLTGLQVKGLV